MPEPIAQLVDSVPEEAPAPAPADAAASGTPSPTPQPNESAPSADAPVVEKSEEVSPAAGDPTPQEVLYDLPDGRKVNAETLAREFKENFLPDYTRKSQRLAEIEKPINNPNENTPAWAKPDFVPDSWQQVIELAKKEALEELARGREAEAARIEQVSKEIDGQLAEIRKTEPNVDENALFQHANKWGFRDLRQAHANMAEMKKISLTTEQRVLKNVQTRAADPVASQPVVSAPSDAIDMAALSGIGSAQEFLARLKGR